MAKSATSTLSSANFVSPMEAALLSSDRDLLQTIEGPKVKADVIEVQESGRTFHEVRHDGKADRFLAMGEAFIVAGELTGNPLYSRIQGV